MLKDSYTFEKYYVALPYKEGGIMLKGSSGQWNQSLMRVLAYDSAKPEWKLPKRFVELLLTN